MDDQKESDERKDSADATKERHQIFQMGRETNYTVVLENLVSEKDVETFREIHADYVARLNQESTLNTIFDMYLQINSENTSVFFNENNGISLYQVLINCVVHKMKLHFHLLCPESRKMFYMSFVRYFYGNPSFSFYDKKIYEMLTFYYKLENYMFFHDYGSNLYDVSNSIMSVEIGDPNFMEANIFYVDDHIFLNYIIIDIFRKKIKQISADLLFDNYVKRFYYIHYYTDMILLNCVYRILVDKLLVLSDSDADDFYEENKEIFQHIINSNPSSIFYNLWTILKIRVTISLLSLTELILFHIHLFYVYQTKLERNQGRPQSNAQHIQQAQHFSYSVAAGNLKKETAFTLSEISIDEFNNMPFNSTAMNPMQKKTLWIVHKKKHIYSKYFIRLIDSTYQINYFELSIFDLYILTKHIQLKIIAISRRK